MAAHAAWWTALVVVALYGRVNPYEAVVPTAASLALLLVPRVPRAGRFQPAAFQRTLLLVVLVMIGQAAVTVSRAGFEPRSLGFAAVVGLSAWGLFRLQAWAVFLGLLAEQAMLALSLGVVITSSPQPEAYAWVGTSLLASIGLTLVLLSMGRGRAFRLPEPPAWIGRLRPVVILALWLVTVVRALGWV